MTPEVRHIDAFLAVARCGTFTRAAADLRVSQPALTVHVRQLESALGVRLFNRNNRRVALTAIGRDLLGPLERILLDLRAIVESAHDTAAHRRGVVTVACLPSIGAARLPEAIAALSARHEAIVVRVRDVVAGRVVEMVRSGEADFGISSCDRLDRELIAEPLFDDRIAAFVRADHEIAARPQVTLRHLAALPLVVTGRDSSVRDLLDRALDKARLQVQFAQDAAYMTTALGMVSAGLGVAILPDAAAGLASGIVRVPIVRPVLARRIGIIQRAGRSLSPAAKTLAEVLKGRRS